MRFTKVSPRSHMRSRGWRSCSGSRCSRSAVEERSLRRRVRCSIAAARRWSTMGGGRRAARAGVARGGGALPRGAKGGVGEAARLEHAAGELAKGWEAEIRIAVEILFPTWLLVQCLGAFSAERPDTRIELYETVLGGTDEALAARRVDFAITSILPQGLLGDELMRVRGVLVAAPSHPLH